MKNLIVVGGGVSGLLSSILAVRKGYNVYLVESAKKLGGLLSSQNVSGRWFDYGTHIPVETGIEELDQMLFPDFRNDSDWISLEMLSPANYFAGKLNTNSQLMNLTELDQVLYKSSFVEIVSSLITNPMDYSNLSEYLLAAYGKTVTENVYKPLMKKVQTVDLKELHPTAHKYYGYERVIISNDSDSVAALKKLPHIDAKTSFVTSKEGVSKLGKFYPKDLGVGLWIQRLEDQCSKMGVNILLDTKVEKMFLSGKHITSIKLSSGETISCDKVIWTIPAIMGLKSLDLNTNSNQETPRFVDMSLFHFILNKPIKVKNHFIYVNDPNMQSLRITLYPNINQKYLESPHVTVEVIGEASKESILQEMIKIGLFDEDVSIVDSSFVKIPQGFPIMSNKFFQMKNEQIDILQQSVENIQLFGKASRTKFFMNDVLIEIFQEIKL